MLPEIWNISVSAEINAVFICDVLILIAVAVTSFRFCCVAVVCGIHHCSYIILFFYPIGHFCSISFSLFCPSSFFSQFSRSFTHRRHVPRTNLTVKTVCFWLLQSLELKLKRILVKRNAEKPLGNCDSFRKLINSIRCSTLHTLCMQCGNKFPNLIEMISVCLHLIRCYFLRGLIRGAFYIVVVVFKKNTHTCTYNKSG